MFRVALVGSENTIIDPPCLMFRVGLGFGV